MQQFEEDFFKKQTILFAAKDKVSDLKKISELNKLNNLHDLEYRIDIRIKELQDNYYEAHFTEYEFNYYSF